MGDIRFGSSLDNFFRGSVGQSRYYKDAFFILFCLLASIALTLTNVTLFSSPVSLISVKMDVKELVSIGKDMGLQGKDLLEFITAEREKEEKQRERDERAKEREEKQKQRDHELKLKELEAQQLADRKKIAESSSSDLDRGGLYSGNNIPKLPYFKDGKDEIDAYLKRFERYATVRGWPESDWATSLCASLTGKALEVYTRLPDDHALDYKKLKEALLRRYELHDEGFRRKFRSSRLESGETYCQFADRLKRYLMRWIELSKCEKDFDSVIDLMLKEQLFQASDRNLTLFLKERNPQNVSEFTELADRYLQAHPNIVSHIGGKGGWFNSNQRDSRNDKREEGREQKDGQNDTGSNRRACFICDSTDHLMRDCPLKEKLKQFNQKGASKQNSDGGRPWGKDRSDKGASCIESEYKQNVNTQISDHNDVQNTDENDMHIVSVARGPRENMPVTEGVVNNNVVKVLRDTGCSTIVVKQQFVKQKQFTGRYQKCVLLDGTVREIPTAIIWIDTPFLVGTFQAIVMETPLYDLIVGNVKGASDSNSPNPNWSPKEICVETLTNSKQVDAFAVETRGQKAKKGEKLRPLRIPEGPEIATRKEFSEAQVEDPTLAKYWFFASKGDTKVTKQGSECKFVKLEGMLFREFKSVEKGVSKNMQQLVVPIKFRETVLKLAHDSPMAGHLGIQKTLRRIMSKFYWPGVHGDVRRYCISCELCQRTVPKGSVGRVPLGEMPLIDTPFSRVAVDLVGPIDPVTDKGNRYILTLVDYSTRYPEAIALKRIDTETVAEALIEIFSRVGVPCEILSDLGTQFTSELMTEIGRLLRVKQLRTTPYHPMCNGLVERFNGTLKRMLRKMCSERPSDWDRYLPAILFAYREAPQESLGFSPFELLYGRTVRGPLDILRDIWSNELQDEVKSTYQYVFDLKQRLEETCRMAQEELTKSSKRYRRIYNNRSKDRKFKVGDEVLLLMPTSSNKLLTQWQGPYKVTEKVGKHDYKLDVKGKEKLYHANMLKKFVRRDSSKGASLIQVSQSHECLSEESGDQTSHDDMTSHIVAVGVIVTDETEQGIDECGIELPCIQSKEGYLDVKINEGLGDKQTGQMKNLLEEFSDILTDLPGKTDLIEQTIKLTTSDPVRSKPFPVPVAVRQVIKQEVDTLLRMGVIEESSSAYASPVVLVRKKDGTNRFCIDFRKLNAITVLDSEPIPNMDDIMSNLSKAKFLSKIDLSKGYYQIPIAKADREKTAFATPDGLFQFKVLPFGMVNAPAVFSRMMRRLLYGLDNVVNYIDDILIFSDSWESHIDSLKKVLLRLRDRGLTARPSKCEIGFMSLEFLGHVVGEGTMKPVPGKVDKILKTSTPQSKKEIRSFLGLVGYYRRFIPNFSAIAAPLSDLTKGGKPNRLVWGEAQERAFCTLKRRLATAPILRLPDPSKTFILRTDASNIGIGAVLIQQDGEHQFPICFASRKLLPRERNYATIERECLALVWAIQKFHLYLYGKTFILETDHQPLSHIAKAKLNNSRVMRWALSLQPYRYKVRAIKGKDNQAADFLSRCPQV